MKDTQNFEFYLKRINDAMISYANNELKELGLTFSQMEVICYLCENKNKIIYQKDIENHLNLSHPTVIGILKRLKAKELILIEVNSIDKRKRNIKITDKVFEIEEKMNKKKKEMEKHVESFLTTKEIDELERLLKILCENIINKL